MCKGPRINFYHWVGGVLRVINCELSFFTVYYTFGGFALIDKLTVFLTVGDCGRGAVICFVQGSHCILRYSVMRL